MPFNPCGRGVDYMRSTVTDVIRPFKDSSIEVRRRWYRVPEGTPLLGVPSAFLSARYEPYPWLPRDVGEVYPSPVRYTKNKAPTGMTYDHVCGTPEQYAHGAVYDPAFNSHPDEDWIPACCGRIEPPVRGGLAIGGEVGDRFTERHPTEGGVALGGEVGDVALQIDALVGGVQLGGASGETGDYTDPTAGGVQLGGESGETGQHVDPTAGGVQLGGASGETGDYTDPTAGGVQLGGASGDSQQSNDPLDGGVQLGGASGDMAFQVDPLEGGVQLGGEVGDVQRDADPLDGGVQLGGEVGDVYTPGGVTPGTTCATAGAVTLGTTYTSPPTVAGVEQWWHYAVPNGSYTITCTGLNIFGPVNGAWRSAVPCASLGLLNSFGDPGVTVAASGGVGLWLRMVQSFGGGSTYTFKVV